MKIIKRTLAIILAVSLCMSTMVVSFADEAQDALLAQYYNALLQMEASGKKLSAEEQAILNVYKDQQKYATMMSLQAVYPEGMPFTNSISYKWSNKIYIGNVGMIGYGCVAFAMILSDAVFGKNKVKRIDSLSKVRVGDIVRIKNNTHSVIILKISPDGTYTVAEANYGGTVHWGRTFSQGEMQNIFNYAWTRY